MLAAHVLHFLKPLNGTPCGSCICEINAHRQSIFFRNTPLPPLFNVDRRWEAGSRGCKINAHFRHTASSGKLSTLILGVRGRCVILLRRVIDGRLFRRYRNQLQHSSDVQVLPTTNVSCCACMDRASIQRAFACSNVQSSQGHCASRLRLV